ncbi:hypothetical protein CCH79_00012913 [Gambusia affinis]|uniref:THD domain-containing protein n=1 Tax=Gambusia affinis TaxID=33528 RepID=A0A315WAH5_GAMAF|nr:hypothetical protein CCH79_00012913 [Gambusia affinis]
MQRILQRRRVRKLRVVWASLALVALSLAACSALFTAWTWRQTRDLSQSFQILQDRLEQGARCEGGTGMEGKRLGEGGVIKGWEERTLNMSKAVRYNKEEGTFTVERAGVYFLFCQVLFNEQQSQYVKLDVETNGLRPQKLQCMEGYGTTPSAGPHSFHFVKPCQVSGLLRLERGTELLARTGPSFSLHPVANHVFSIFKVN